jgi:hypothetical protein
LRFRSPTQRSPPNYPGEEFETLDRQILVVSADVPPQDRETDAQHQERVLECNYDSPYRVYGPLAHVHCNPSLLGYIMKVTPWLRVRGVSTWYQSHRRSVSFFPLPTAPSHCDSLRRRRLLTVYFGAPSMFITLWFGFDYGTNPPLGTLII